jgi:hypothetical protein
MRKRRVTGRRFYDVPVVVAQEIDHDRGRQGGMCGGDTPCPLVRQTGKQGHGGCLAMSGYLAGRQGRIGGEPVQDMVHGSILPGGVIEGLVDFCLRGHRYSGAGFMRER